MQKGLPLEVLGLISPLLCLVEGGERQGLPDHWRHTARNLEEHELAWLQRELPTYSYDNLDEILEIARNPQRVNESTDWTPEIQWEREASYSPPNGYDLMDAFRKLAFHYLKWTGNELFVRDGLLVELHELGLRFPVRHLIRYCHAEAMIRRFLSASQALGKRDQLDSLHTVYHGLRSVIHRGVFEGHLHLSSILTPDEVWADHIFSRQAVLEGMKTEDWRLVQLARQAVRLMAIGIHLDRREARGEHPPFHLILLLDRIYRTRNRQTMVRLLDRMRKETTALLAESNLAMSRAGRFKTNENMGWLISVLNPSVDRYWSNSRLGVGSSMRKHIELLDRLHFHVQALLLRRDTLVAWQKPEAPLFQEEILRLERNQLPRQDPLRRFVHEIFFRYLTYHGHHWQRGTLSGKTTGLRHFTGRFWARQREPMSSYLEACGLAFERMANQMPLKGVEGRISPPTSPGQVMPWLLAFNETYRQGKLDRFGFVVHFIKSDKREFDASPRPGPVREVRHARVRRRIRHDAMRLFRFLVTPNPVAPFIVGIDAANLELTTPPEVFAPAFRFLRDYPIALRRGGAINRTYGGHWRFYESLNERRLGMTYHVGEDFRHLLSGLRAIHEVIEFLKPIAGDRLGHATALAISPKNWAAQNGYQAILPRQEWLDTLVWLHHCLGTGHRLIGTLQIKDQIQRLSRQIYGSSNPQFDIRDYKHGKLDQDPVDDGWSIPTLYDAWRLRQLDPYSASLKELAFDHDFKVRRDIGKGREHKRWLDIQNEVMVDVNAYVGSNAAYRLLGLYWFNPQVKKIGERLITVDMHRARRDWVAACEEAQARMIELVAARQLVIETNPSSNRLIGPMNSFAEHYIFPLTLDAENRLHRKIRVTVNTDNPGVMATSLTHEYYLLGEIMLERGMPEPEVETWLEWLRKNGEACSFLDLMPAMEDETTQAFFDGMAKRYRALTHGLFGRERRYRPTPWRTARQPRMDRQ